MDIASYFNDMMVDKSNQGGKGIRTYLENCVTDHQMDLTLRTYLAHSAITNSSEKPDQTSIEEQLPLLKEEVKCCMLLNNYLGGIWALQMLSKEDYQLGALDVFNFKLAESRIQMFNFVKSTYFYYP